MDQTPAESPAVVEATIEEYYVFTRENKTSPWLQNSVWATVEDACAAADEVLKALTTTLNESEVASADIFVCKSENGSFPVPFFNWNEQE